MRSVLALLLLLVSICNAQLTRFNLTTVDPQALCNDGTPAVYYFRPGYGSGASTWVIALMGGGWCWDEESCKGRAESTPHLTSSSFCPSSVTDDEAIHNVEHVGILSGNSTDNPYLYNANIAWLWYCSSDSHLGNKTANESLNGWNFMGKTIFKSLVHHLLYEQSPSMLKSSQILLTGSSAGGVGAANNADFLKSIISPLLPSVHYRVFVDAGWFLDIPPFTGSFSFQMVAKALFDNWGVIYNDLCVASYGIGNEWHCFHSQYLVDYLTTPALFQEFQFDSANLNMDGVSYPITNKTQAYFTNFQQDMLNLTTRVQTIDSLFMPNCYLHQTISLPLIYTVKIGGVSIADAMWKWFMNPTPLAMRIVDSCKPINCGTTCPPL